MSLVRAACVLALLAAAPTPPQTAPPASTETATQTYLRFRLVALNATSIDEITAFWGPDLMHEFSMMPDSAKAGTLDIVKRMEGMVGDVKVVDEKPTSTGATLTLEGTGTGTDKAPMTGTVEMMKDAGRWKLAAQEQWQPKRSGISDEATSSPCHPRSAPAR